MTKPDFGPAPAPDFVVEPSDDDVAFFREHGYLVVDRLTTDDEIDWMRAIFEFVFSPDNAGHPAAPIDRSGTLADGEESQLSQAFFPEIRFPELLDTTHRRNAKRFAASLLGVDEGRLSSWGHMIRKPAGGRAALWHQDHAYWEPELDYLALGCWTPMHDVTVEMGAMQFIPGSHSLGLLPHRHADEPQHNVLTVAVPVDDSTAVACPLRKGGATFHHPETLHYTAPNTTDNPRLGFPMEFQVMPERRDVPESMPWVDERRAVIETGPLVVVADGRVLVV